MGTHWYIEDDEGVARRYSQLTKKGTERKRILSEQAMEDGAGVGVTTILGFIGGVGGLLNWSGNLGVIAGVNAGFRAASRVGQEALDNEDMVSAVLSEAMIEGKEEYKKLSTEARDKGSEIHNAIDDYLKGGPISTNTILATAQTGAKKYLEERWGITEATYEHCGFFKGEILGVPVAFGGTSDVVTPSLILDWKTLEEKAYGYRSAQPTEAAQCAAYRKMLKYEKAKCINAYIDRDTGEIVMEKEWTEAELRVGLQLFVLAYQAREIYSKLESMIKEATK